MLTESVGCYCHASSSYTVLIARKAYNYFIVKGLGYHSVKLYSVWSASGRVIANVQRWYSVWLAVYMPYPALALIMTSKCAAGANDDGPSCFRKRTHVTAGYAFASSRRGDRSVVSADHRRCWILPQRDRDSLSGQRSVAPQRQQPVRAARMSARRHQVSVLGAVRHQSSTSRSSSLLRRPRRLLRAVGYSVRRQHCCHRVQRSVHVQVLALSLGCWYSNNNNNNNNSTKFMECHNVVSRLQRRWRNR